VTEGSYETNRIERDLEATRARLDATIGALQQKLSPGQLLDQSLAYMRESGGGEFASNLKHNIQTHPMPVALIGVGLAWLMMSGNGQGRAASEAWPEESTGSGLAERAEAAAAGIKRSASETLEAFEARVYAAKGMALGLRQNVGESMSAFGSRVDEAMRSARAGGRAAVDSVRHATASAAGSARDTASRAAGYLQDQPLLLGALGVSVGALLAAVLPPSRAEDQLLGGLRDDLRDRAGEVAGAALAGGARIAGEAIHAGRETARREGLTADDAGSAAASVAPQVAGAAAGARRVIEDTVAAGRQALDRELSGDTEGRRGADPGHGI
jgi:hypothetical protein